VDGRDKPGHDECVILGLFYTSLIGACDHLFFGRHAMSRATGVGPVTDEVCRQYIKHMEALICGGILKRANSE
jgi:hypothetical protein